MRSSLRGVGCPLPPDADNFDGKDCTDEFKEEMKEAVREIMTEMGVVPPKQPAATAKSDEAAFLGGGQRRDVRKWDSTFASCLSLR